MSLPIVSVITPTRNRPELLAEAIASVLAQSFSDFEMLVVDDGSHPPAQAVVARFADPRLRYIFQRHAGRSAARNRALATALGEFIAFLDDDDLYHPEKLALETAFLQAHPDIDILGSGYRLLEKQNQELSTVQPWEFKAHLNRENCLFDCPLITCSVLIRRSALQRLDHCFDARFDMAEDADFFMRLLLSGARFAWLKEVLCDYRLLHDHSPLILLDIYRTHRAVLEKQFANTSLPEDVAAQRSDIFLHHTLKIAWRAFDHRMPTAGQRFLLHALLQEPRLAEDKVVVLEESLISAARRALYTREPSEFLDYILTHLPAPLGHLAKNRQRLLDCLESAPVQQKDRKQFTRCVYNNEEDC